MQPILVSIDLETTGLDPNQDAIIEIGAVRFQGDALLGEFSTLINPGRAVSAFVSNLTGIQSSDLFNAPTIESVLDDLKAFVGDAPIVAHNVRFDASFLYRQGLFLENTRIDTFELASILMPRAPRYTLTSLTSDLGFVIGNAHRALYDAKATAFLHQRLRDYAQTLPAAIIREIVEATQRLPKEERWDAAFFFEALLATVSDTASLTKSEFTPPLPPPSRQPHDPTIEVSSKSIAQFLGIHGAISRVIPGFEPREQQIALAQSVIETFDTGHHQIIEAGTGTGKSIGYLLPAILWSRSRGETVVIATDTLHLQDQLMGHDLPMLRAALDIPFQAALLKGRGNYLCPRRFDEMRMTSVKTLDELRMLAKVLVWQIDNTDGDRADLSLRGYEEYQLWARISADDPGCTTDRCRAAITGGCPFYRAQQAADAADIVIANHALLVNDANTDQRTLPDYNYAIIDEAHHLEEAVTNALKWSIDMRSVQRLFGDVAERPNGLLPRIEAAIIAGGDHSKLSQRVLDYMREIDTAARGIRARLKRLFDIMRALSPNPGNDFDSSNNQHRITDADRRQNAYNEAQTEWRGVQPFISALGEALGELTKGIARLAGALQTDKARWIQTAQTLIRALGDLDHKFDRFFAGGDANTVYWLSVHHNAVSLCGAPLNTGSLLEQTLWATKRGILLTGATLQANDSFAYLQDRIGGEAMTTRELGSPFDYRRSTLVILPTDLPDPSDKVRYQTMVERTLIDLSVALKGRLLVLFTSYYQLQQTAQAISARLALGGITVYDQSSGSSRQALLDSFRTTEKAVLLGTRGMWEGIDIPGEALSGLVIVRLPFSMPNDPVYSARADRVTDSFNDYTLPDAIIRFRQGFGRLIRSSSDRGVVVILDGRIRTKAYGRQFIAALPNPTVRDDLPVTAIAPAARQWLDGSA